jgi:hypothetical protein
MSGEGRPSIVSLLYAELEARRIDRIEDPPPERS